MSIGGMVGGAVDPTKVYGPHVGDGQAQSATDGSPISWVMGTMWVAGTICDVGVRQEFAVKQQGGKGSGTEQYSYEAHQNFSILVCESDAIKGSTISSVLMVEQDGKIVYDVRPGSTMLADSAKWLARNCIFYYGDEAQLPTAADEAAHGVGNAPAYRAVLRAFFTQFNVTAAGDRIPSFRFLVSSDANRSVPINATWRYLNSTYDTPIETYVGVDIDDSKWNAGSGPFGNLANNPSFGVAAHAANSEFLETITTPLPLDGFTTLRDWLFVEDNTDGNYYVSGCISTSERVFVYINGVNYFAITGDWSTGGYVEFPASHFNKGMNLIALVFEDDADHYSDDISYMMLELGPVATSSNMPALEEVVTSICARGGIGASQLDASELADTPVPGYAIAKQMNAVNALGPLLGAYFAYASEYDGKINFHFYGADAVMTIDEDDLLEANDANDNAVTANLRNNATEFPRRIIGRYYDPTQNYMPVTVMQVRRAAGVTATGDLSMDIPVVMAADQAQQTVDKALKVAYAQLEGTLQFCVPFAGKDNVYLSLVSGDAVLFRGKRWIVQESILSAGYIKLTILYDRQGAYTSNVQAIPGLTPTPPVSRYSGPTKIIPMNLPQLQSQDAYGVYFVTYSDPHNDNWRSATIQMSLDAGATWQTVATSNSDSVTGALTAADGGASLVVQTNGDLASVGSAQLDAKQNAAVLIHGTSVEVLQYGTATEDPATADLYTLTDLRRAQLGTTQIAGVVGDQFVTLDNAQLIPIDVSFAGTTIQFRAIGAGENADDAAVVSIVYQPDTTTVISGGTFGDGL